MTKNRHENVTGLLLVCTLAAAAPAAAQQKPAPPPAEVKSAPTEAKNAPHPSAGNCTPCAFSLSISGLVRQPLNLTRDDLRRFQAAEVQINDVKADGDYQGVFVFRGVPLKMLLEQATVAKESAVFRREMDLAIVARSRSGKRALLSWGEIFYRNPGEIIVAYEATPVVPHHGCDNCHSPDEYEGRLRKLDRAVGFPKLVVGGDFYSDRSLEDVVSIEVADLGRDKGLHIAKGQGPKKLWSKEIVIPGKKGGKQTTIRSLAGKRRFRVDVMKSGTGAGYHGVRRYSGVTLRELLAAQGFGFDPGAGFLLSAADGYRVLISSGELFGSAGGYLVLVADKLNDKPIDEDGRFVVVIPEDLHADRWLKAPARIDVVRATEPARLTVIGVGPGDTSLISLQAVSAIARADAIIASDDIQRRFAKYIGDRPRLFDQLSAIKDKSGNYRAPTRQVRHTLFEKSREAEVSLIRRALKEGKNVALLDYGDPTIFGTWRFVARGNFPPDQLVLLPGMSSVNAANALLGKDIEDAGALVVASPRELENNGDTAAALAGGGETVAILVGLTDIKRTAALLDRYWPSETPVAIVYRAGYGDAQQVVRTTLADLERTVNEHEERHLGIIYIGKHL